MYQFVCEVLRKIIHAYVMKMSWVRVRMMSWVRFVKLEKEVIYLQKSLH